MAERAARREWDIAAAIAADYARLRAAFETEDDVSFAAFARAWRRLKFEYVHLAARADEEDRPLVRGRAGLPPFRPPSLTGLLPGARLGGARLVPDANRLCPPGPGGPAGGMWRATPLPNGRVTAAQPPLVAITPRQHRVCCVYTLYALYHTQLSRDPPVHIRVSPGVWQQLATLVGARRVTAVAPRAVAHR